MIINNHGNGEEDPFLKICASPCYYLGNRQLRNVQSSTPPFTDVYGPLFHEGTSKHEGVFKSLTVYVSAYTELCAGANRGPIGQALKNNK